MEKKEDILRKHWDKIHLDLHKNQIECIHNAMEEYANQFKHSHPISDSDIERMAVDIWNPKADLILSEDTIKDHAIDGIIEGIKKGLSIKQGEHRCTCGGYPDCICDEYKKPTPPSE